MKHFVDRMADMSIVFPFSGLQGMGSVQACAGQFTMIEAAPN